MMKRRKVVQVPGAERLRFALRLVAADVPQFRSPQLHALWRQQRAFMGLPPTEGIKVVGTAPAAARFVTAQDERHRAELLAMQADARALLAPIAAGGAITVSLADVTATGRLGEPDSLAYQGAPVDAFRVALGLWLMSGEGRQVRPCPECGALFYRIRRQIYCSAVCTDRATWRAYPAEKKAEARAKYYEQNNWTLGARTGRRKA